MLPQELWKEPVVEMNVLKYRINSVGYIIQTVKLGDYTVDLIASDKILNVVRINRHPTKNVPFSEFQKVRGWLNDYFDGLYIKFYQ